MRIYGCNLLDYGLGYVILPRNAPKLLCFKDKLAQLSLTGTCPLSKVHCEEKWVNVSFSGETSFKVAPVLRGYCILTLC
jgi:hypothetical protein